MQTPHQVPPHAPPHLPLSPTAPLTTTPTLTTPTTTGNKRRTHRKRASNLRLSSDTTSTLPEYLPSAVWNRTAGTGGVSAAVGVDDLLLVPEDRPPDYSDSAEEADEDTDTSEKEKYKFIHPTPPPSATFQTQTHTAQLTPGTGSGVYLHHQQQQQQLVSPMAWRKKRYGGSGSGFGLGSGSTSTHRRKHSQITPTTAFFHTHTPSPSFSSTLSAPTSTDSYLDSLLERSVHALEMSNTLLQTSISTQTSLSNVIDSPDLPPTLLPPLPQPHVQQIPTRILPPALPSALHAPQLTHSHSLPPPPRSATPTMTTPAGMPGMGMGMSGIDYNLEMRARGLSARIRDTKEKHEHWVDELEELRRGVDSLFEEGSSKGYGRSGGSGSGYGYDYGNAYGYGYGAEEAGRRRDDKRRYNSLSMEGPHSSSVPTSSPISYIPSTPPRLEPPSSHQRAQRKSSSELRTLNQHRSVDISSSYESPRSSSSRMDVADPKLRYGAHQHANLVAPPPRAMTQYVTVSTTEKQKKKGVLRDMDEDVGAETGAESSSGATQIVLPSTIGLRASASSHFVPAVRPDHVGLRRRSRSSEDLRWSARAMASGDREDFGGSDRGHSSTSTSKAAGGGGGLTNSANVNLHASPSSPRLTKQHSQPTTAAYNLLSSFVYQNQRPQSPTAPISAASPSTPGNGPTGTSGLISINPIASLASLSAFVKRSRSLRGSGGAGDTNPNPNANPSPRADDSGNGIALILLYHKELTTYPPPCIQNVVNCLGQVPRRAKEPPTPTHLPPDHVLSVEGFPCRLPRLPQEKVLQGLILPWIVILTGVCEN
ncbi:hypothetical protein AX16_007767 [Volvariella volvacea WC 439]|nr:hypothetical protein AX16_007767 [Volvariella volvacea WC 439]